MAEDFWHALCALAALFIPMGFAWLVLRLAQGGHAKRRMKAAEEAQVAHGARATVVSRKHPPPAPRH